MFMKNWKREIFTIPNMLSLLRLMLIPIYCMIYLNARQYRDYLIAGAILTVSCLTDAADGLIARKFNMISTVGKLLDPMADKLTQISLTLCLSLKHPVLLPVIVLLLTKELFQIIGAVILLRSGMPFPSAMPAGKISTIVLFTSLITLVIFPQIPKWGVCIIALTDSVFLLFAFITYYGAFFENHKRAHRS